MGVGLVRSLQPPDILWIHWRVKWSEVKSLSRVRLFATPWTVAYQAPSMGFSGKNTGVGYHFLLQRIFPTQGSNRGLPHCRQTLYRLSHQGSLVLTLDTIYSWWNYGLEWGGHSVQRSGVLTLLFLLNSAAIKKNVISPYWEKIICGIIQMPMTLVFSNSGKIK